MSFLLAGGGLKDTGEHTVYDKGDNYTAICTGRPQH